MNSILINYFSNNLFPRSKCIFLPLKIQIQIHISPNSNKFFHLKRCIRWQNEKKWRRRKIETVSFEKNATKRKTKKQKKSITKYLMRTVGMRFILGKYIKIDECMSCRVGRNCLAPALPKTKVNKSTQKKEKK